MKVFKKIALCMLTAFSTSYAYADVIELDASNPDHCRQQILNSTDDLPIIAAYKNNPNDSSVNFMQKFEALAKQHPERTFYKWNADNDELHLTLTLCIQQIGVPVVPSIMMLGVFTDDYNAEKYMSSPLRMSWAGEMTTLELNKFIDVSDSKMKNAALLQRR